MLLPRLYRCRKRGGKGEIEKRERDGGEKKGGCRYVCVKGKMIDDGGRKNKIMMMMMMMMRKVDYENRREEGKRKKNHAVGYEEISNRTKRGRDNKHITIPFYSGKKNQRRKKPKKRKE